MGLLLVLFSEINSQKYPLKFEFLQNIFEVRSSLNTLIKKILTYPKCLNIQKRLSYSVSTFFHVHNTNFIFILLLLFLL